MKLLKMFLCCFGRLKAAFLIPLLFLSAVPAWGAPEGLPPAEWFVPEVSSNAPVQPFLMALNWAIVVIACVFLGYAMLRIIFVVKDLLTGKETLQSKMNYFIGVGVGVFCLMLGITGQWYNILLFGWEKIVMPIMSYFK